MLDKDEFREAIPQLEEGSFGGGDYCGCDGTSLVQ